MRDDHTAKELQEFIFTSPLVDTHEHMWRRDTYIQENLDVLSDLAGHYLAMDLRSSGLSQDDLGFILSSDISRLEERWDRFQKFWQHCRHTGYGRGTRIIAREAYGMEEINLPSLIKAQEQYGSRDRAGERLRIMRDVARIDHVQTDDMWYKCPPDEEDPEFFLYDLTWWDLSSGKIDTEALHEASDIDVYNIATLRDCIETIVSRNGPDAIAMKTQYAYSRTLDWHPRSDEEAGNALASILTGKATAEDRIVLGDWCLARGIEAATRLDLPVKIHTGYLAHNNQMEIENCRVSRLCKLLVAYPDTKFVLMHIAACFENELLGMAKHFQNVYVDMCWAWAINPRKAVHFVRDFLYQVPVNKLFAYGGDTATPMASLGFSKQARTGLFQALKEEMDEGNLDESDALEIAGKVMMKNQYAVFDIKEKQKRALLKSRQ